MSHEVELKLTLPQVAVEALLDALGEPHSVTPLHNQYFDTPDLQLNQAHAALRIRKTPTGYVQTLKNKGVAIAGLHQRGEWEYQISEPKLEWSLFSDVPLDNNLKEQVSALFSTDFDRCLWNIQHDQSEIEVVLDQGLITAIDDETEHSIALCEVELELKSGDVNALFTFAQSLCQKHPLVPCDINKAERGYALINSQVSFYESISGPDVSNQQYLEDCLMRMSRTWDAFIQKEDLFSILNLYRQVCGAVLVIQHVLDAPQLLDQWRKLQSSLQRLLDKAQVPMALFLDDHSNSRGLSQRLLKSMQSSLWSDIDTWIQSNELGQCMLAMGAFLYATEHNKLASPVINCGDMTRESILLSVQHLNDLQQLQGLADIYKRKEDAAYQLLEPLINHHLVILGMMHAKNSSLGTDQDSKAKLDSWARRLTVMQRHLQHAQHAAQQGWL
ncbi:CYTH domain-containing protein [Bermanella marisrubri]|uniref:Adenylate cyclase n=1 Tax=Bermanella marisrubri TaxID=207949 RepID=Q1MZH3_9GAMM|nr:CYTH domain-containing protein [Bermanella marisrubri]EAT11438.1 Adenylate cyclase [Oceanobacter sp. RED65] [Bermanella marisrubri]QIZ85566.1 CYTH domain-containing protein [Bermanella marisrubri]